MQYEHAQDLAETTAHRNVHRMHSLGDVVLPLGSLSMQEVLTIREQAIHQREMAQTDLFVIDDELARRTPLGPEMRD